MRIVATPAEVPANKVTTKSSSYNGKDHKMTFGAEQTVQNTPAGRVAVTNANYAEVRKMRGGDKQLYAVGTVTAQPDKIGNRHLDDFTREPKPAFVMPDQYISETK